MPSFTRPPHYPYSFKAFRDIPRRLFHPPPSQIKIGRVRSISLTPLLQVKLSDVLDGQHLPPLSKKDFEEYLLFVERSPENLYFIEWLRDYSKAYDTWARSGKSYSAPLALSWSRAKETFFSNDAHYRLNLSQSLLEGLIAASDVQQSPGSQPTKNPPVRPSYPSPSDLVGVQRAVEDMLRESLNRFVCGSCGNSGRARGLFGIALGVITLAAGLAPVLVSILGGRGGRAMRVAAIPVFWLGAWVTIMSLHGVCIVIFLFGDARQLYPYELARPKITSPLCRPQTVIVPAPDNTRDSSSEKTVDEPDQSQLYVDLEGGNMGSCSSASTMAKQSRQHATSVASSVAGLDPNARGESCELTVMTSPHSLAVSPTSASNLIRSSVGSPPSDHRWTFDFDALPSPAPNAPRAANLETWDTPLEGQHEKFKSIPTFGPLTKVLSPVITRAQWEIVIRSALLAIVVALVLGAICLAIPPRK